LGRSFSTAKKKKKKKKSSKPLHSLLALFNACHTVTLEAAKKKWLQDLVKLAEDLELGLLAKFLGRVVREKFGEVEPALKKVNVVEEFWEKEVEEGPELGEVVLQRGSGQEEAVA